MTLDDAGGLPIKIVSLYRQEHGCSSELLRCSSSDAGIEIKSIPVFCCPSVTL